MKVARTVWSRGKAGDLMSKAYLLLLTEELSNVIDRTEFNGIPLLDHGVETTTGAISETSETIVKTRGDFCKDFSRFWVSWSGWNEFTVDGQDPTGGWFGTSSWFPWNPEMDCHCFGGDPFSSSCPMCAEVSVPGNWDWANNGWVEPYSMNLRNMIFDDWLETRPELQNRPDIVTSLREDPYIVWEDGWFPRVDCTTEWTILIDSDLGGYPNYSKYRHGLHIQTGANANESLLIPLPNFNIFVDEDVAGPLVRLINSFEDLTLETHSDITVILDDIDLAIGELSETRAVLGAIQNRLEHTINNLQIASENTSAAESRIRDTDMAREMMRLTMSNVLQQAATSMLAQANQAPQAVLQLLQ